MNCYLVVKNLKGGSNVKKHYVSPYIQIESIESESSIICTSDNNIPFNDLTSSN